MKLRGWHIEGFGSLVDWRHDELSDELNVFYGPNEAGKSTLLGFLRFALFGFRPGNTKDAKYPPPPGIKHGGSLFLDEDAGAFTVERLASAGRGGKRLRIERANGEEAPEAELTRLLGHADRDLFNNVFAFSLTELQSFESLTEKGVQDHIFSAGITGAGRSARDALDQIRKEADQLFKGRAKTRVSILVEEIAKLDESLQAGRERAQAYPELAENERELKAQCVALRAEIDGRRGAGLRARKLGDLWREVYGPMLENRRQLEAFTVSDGFAADSRGRLDRFVALLERTSEQVAATDSETRKLALRLEGLSADPGALAVRDAVLALERDVGLYEQQCKEVTSSEQLVAVRESGLRDAFADLGPDWDEARLRATHISLSITDEATRFEERLDAARNQVRDFERKLRDGAERCAEMKEARDVEAQSHQDDDALASGGGHDDEQGASSEDLDRRAAALRALHADVAKRATLEVQLDSACAFVDATQRANAAGSSAGANRLRLGALAAAVLGAGTALVLFANNGFQFSTAPVFVVALAMMAFGLITAAFAGGGDRSDGAPVTGAPNLDALEADLATLNEGIDAAAKALGIEAAPSAESIEAATVALERVRRDHAERTEARRQVERLDADIARVERANATVSKSVATSGLELETINVGWTQWAEGVGLPASMVPRNVERFAGEIKSVRGHLDARDHALTQQASLFSAIDGWEERVRRVLADAEEPVPESLRSSRGDPGLITSFTRLVRRVRDADECERQRPDVDRAAAELQEGAIKLQVAEQKAREDVDELFARVGARDREDYLAKLADYERKTLLEAKVSDQVAELSRRIGLGDEAIALRTELETGRVAVWEAEASAAESEAARLQTESDELVRTHRDVEIQIDDLHGSNDVGTLELNRASLQQDLNECIARWRELQVARGLIERTLEQFERERQPAVLQEASHHFATVTGGRYPKIVQSAELGTFSVVDANGDRKALDELSRGTAEQLYVCIRLGLIAEFCRRAGQLPVAMDDVLVNFDDERALAMATVLADFSQRNSCQVLVFTCSSRTRDLFQQAAPTALHLEFGNNAAQS